MNKILVIPALLLLGALAVGQTAPPPVGQTAPTIPPVVEQNAPAPLKNPISSALIDILPARQKNTLAAVEAMPADKFTYQPSAAQVTFGHLVAHMIEANYMLCSGAAAVPVPKVEPRTEFEGKDKLVPALKDSFEFCSEALAKMEDSKLNEMAAGPGGQQLSRARFALGVASNWADHYAEAAMYLRLNGILPPTAKK
jgi:DinB superfamily